MAESTKPSETDKPAKPYDDFPLFPHATRRWAKKINGKMFYFGPWGEPNKYHDNAMAALAKFQEQRDDLYAGRKPRNDANVLRLHHLCNDFWNAKKLLVDRGEMKAATLRDYDATNKFLIEVFDRSRAVDDLRPEDFRTLADKMKDWAPVTRANEIQRVRTIFKWGYESGLLTRPILFGPDFKKPSAKVIRAFKKKKGEKHFTAAEIRKLLAVADFKLRAMILLGVNCGLGNTDISELNRAHLDLGAGVLDFSRGKTAIDRRATLWPETVKALRMVIAWADAPIANPKNKGLPHYHPEADEDKDAVFLTAQQLRYVRRGGEGSDFDSVAQAFGKACTAAGIKREGVGFYALRHVFRTVGSGAGDREAVDRVMGHINASVGDTHYQHFQKDAEENKRLRKVTNYVRAWLWQQKK